MPVVAGVSEVEARRQAVISARSAYEASQVGLEVGTRTVVDVLINQQNLFNAQDALAQTKLARLQAHLALYNALGGGWEQTVSDKDYKNQLDWWPL